MKEIIEGILQEEKTARERVEKAREKAKDIRLESEKKAKEILSNARDKAQAENKALIDKARKEAEKEKVKAIEEAERAGETLWEEKKEKIDKTVQKIFKRIILRDNK